MGVPLGSAPDATTPLECPAHLLTLTPPGHLSVHTPKAKEAPVQGSVAASQTYPSPSAQAPGTSVPMGALITAPGSFPGCLCISLKRVRFEGGVVSIMVPGRLGQVWREGQQAVFADR